MKKKIQETVRQLVEKHGTNMPFELCNKLGIHVVNTNLPSGVNGLFVKLTDIDMAIIINESLSEKQSIHICAHELGHVLMHNHVNSMLLEDNKIRMDALEKEADFFGHCLLASGAKTGNSFK